MTEFTAKEILNHCKAVCEGQIPQPLPFWVVSDSDGLESPQYVFYYSKPTDDEENPIALILWGFPDQIQAETLQLAARILGIDRPAPLTVTVPQIEWATLSNGSPCKEATYNSLIGCRVWLHKGKHNASVWIKLAYTDTITACSHGAGVGFPTFEEAEKWCIDKVIEITSQSK